MIRRSIIQRVLLILCITCTIWGFLPSNAPLAREGMLTAASALWLFRVRMLRSRCFQPEMWQLGAILALGLVLYRLGNLPAAGFIWDTVGVKAAMIEILSRTVAYLVIPSCLCFYLLTPEKRVKESVDISTLRRPVIAGKQANYRIAV